MKIQKYDVIVAGAGHAGCEAAMALAKLGHKTLLITGNIDRIGYLSCNPAIGGLAKGHIVKEIDALGGMMGLWADAAGIQFRTLNMSKGPAVRATRAQIDREKYIQIVKNDIFKQKNLFIWQDIVHKIQTKNGHVTGVETVQQLQFQTEHVLLTTGTFLTGKMHIGLTNMSGGRLGDSAVMGLSQSLNECGLKLGRLKTGTPPRLLKSSINFSKMEEQQGDTPRPSFSFHGIKPQLAQVPCHITWTNEKTHQIIRSGFDRSPLFTGIISGTGARYCPSIEDKIARFPDRIRHQIFIEPEGLNSQECYVNGVSTSLPIDIQKDLIESVIGLENAHIVRPGYAIEYDYANPMQLFKTLQSKTLNGLWLAGQINGTSGYEEAAAQGLWAALNISANQNNQEPFILQRHEAYIGVLIDDLVTLGTEEPYRMFTSRAEHRLLLRENNADARLTEIGRERALVQDEQWKIYCVKKEQLKALTALIEQIRIKPDSQIQEILQNAKENPLKGQTSLAEILKRPSLNLGQFLTNFPELQEFSAEVIEEAEVNIKYAGYLQRQQELVNRYAKSEKTCLPDNTDYAKIAGLSCEVVEKLSRVLPKTLGQASRISGITPAAITCLEIYLKKNGLI